MTRSQMDPNRMIYRNAPTLEDMERVRKIIDSSGFFYDDEVEVAIELVRERLSKGTPSGYYFLFAEKEGEAIGYTCYGPIACTRSSYDLYWIAIQNDLRGSGIGKELLRRTEREIQTMGGERIYIETSSRKKYQTTHTFYRHCGYREEAVLKDFYATGDDKIIFVKVL